MDFQPLSSLAQELNQSVRGVVKSELRLAKAELKENSGHVLRHSLRLAIAVAGIVLGCLSLLAFLVIGLGELLGGRFWLSSLIVALVLAGVGGIAAYFEVLKIKNSDLGLPETRDSVAKNIRTIEGKLRRISS